MKLNLGGGGIPIEGYIELDRITGQEIYPLTYKDAAAAEIRASHCLEHFSFRQVGDVLKEWVRVLEPGGVLKIAVPDFAKIAQWYLEKREGLPLQAYVVGSQMDDDGYHKAIFDHGLLTQCLRNAGLVDIKSWVSEIEDNAAMEVSLNLQGTKPGAKAEVERTEPVKIIAVASVPRLGFNANWHCTLRAMLAMGIQLEMVEGVFWGQCLTRGIEKTLKQEPDIILTLDYDSIFDVQHITKMLQLFMDDDDYDIVVPVQVKRECNQVLFKMNGSKDFTRPLTPISAGHFGLTVFDAKAFERIPKPWIMGVPNAEGDWNDGHVDDDMYFWEQCQKGRLKIGLANEVKIGHLELGITWPDQYFKPIRQSVSEYRQHGQPPECGGDLKIEFLK